MTEKKDIFEQAAENPKELLENRKGLYLMINAIAKHADFYEREHRHLFFENKDMVKIATDEITNGKVKIFRSKDSAMECLKHNQEEMLAKAAAEAESYENEVASVATEEALKTEE